MLVSKHGPLVCAHSLAPQPLAMGATLGLRPISEALRCLAQRQISGCCKRMYERASERESERQRGRASEGESQHARAREREKKRDLFSSSHMCEMPSTVSSLLAA